MTRKHFEAIAKEFNRDIKQHLRGGEVSIAHAIHDTATGMYDIFVGFNSYFDASKWRKALIEGITPCNKYNVKFLTEVEGVAFTNEMISSLPPDKYDGVPADTHSQ